MDKEVMQKIDHLLAGVFQESGGEKKTGFFTFIKRTIKAIKILKGEEEEVGSVTPKEPDGLKVRNLEQEVKEVGHSAGKIVNGIYHYFTSEDKAFDVGAEVNRTMTKAKDLVDSIRGGTPLKGGQKNAGKGSESERNGDESARIDLSGNERIVRVQGRRRESESEGERDDLVSRVYRGGETDSGRWIDRGVRKGKNGG